MSVTNNCDQTRRRALGIFAAATAGSVTNPLCAAVTPTARSHFPPGFIWGTATAAHQVEGNNVNNDTWLLETLKGSGFKEPSGDACDHYHRYPSDIALLAKLGFNTYRFSVEWARVEPNPGQFSHSELDHYRDMLETCRRHGLKTVVTLHHFTSPRWLSAQGGFENPETIAAFARYATAVIAHCGDLIDYLCTINEANLSFTQFIPPAAVAGLNAAAAKASGSSRFSSFLFADVAASKPIARQAHIAARAAIKRLHPTLPVGLTLAMSDIQDAPDAPGQGAIARSAMYDVWLKAAREDDFVGVQNYTRERYGVHGPIDPPAGTIRSQLNQEYYPQALGNAVRYAASVAKVPVLVTENGIGIEDDTIRCTYIREALRGLHEAMADGVDVRGYIHWSAMDNFEWVFGYGPKFGLIAVDRATQQRTPKPSAYLMGQIARTGSV